MKSALVILAVVSAVLAQQPLYAQCGGIGWTGGTTCASGSVCTVLNDCKRSTGYYQCLPGSSPTTTTTSSGPTSTPIPSANRLPFLGGVNMAGYDFSVTTDGSFKNNAVDPPAGQFAHFASQGVNLFRIPFAWQLMTPTLGGSIDQTFLSRYDNTVQTALNSATQPYVIIDLHNYARWNGGVIAQGGPSNDQYVSIWSQLAKKYANNQKVIFGIMNEPHDLTVSTWVQTVQLVVNAIRAAGATTNYILIPGSTYSSAGTLPNEAGPALLQVTDPSGGTSRLIFDVHQYLDSDYSGTHVDCTYNNVNTLTTLVNFLKSNGNRQAILSETGAGSSSSCYTLFGQELAFVKANSDTIAGFAVWSAGAFDTTYVLTVTPNADGSDQPIWTNAVRPNLP